MSKVKITDHAIKKQLAKFNPEDAICEYIWNGFDAGATTVELKYEQEDFLTNINKFTITDNGTGINFDDLELKFIPYGESEKAFKLKEKNVSLHGKNGYGRLTFFKFAQKATWKTFYKNENNTFSYSIVIESKALDDYDPSQPEQSSQMNTGTQVEFENLLIDFHPSYVEKKLIPYLTDEFAWYLEVHKERNFQLLINGVLLEYNSLILDREDFVITVQDIDKKATQNFSCTFIHWKEKLNDEFSKFYFLSTENKLKNKTTTKLNRKGDQFFHSVIVKSDFFENFSYYEEDGEDPEMRVNLFTEFGDAKIYRELIKQLNAYLRKKRKPFLHAYANVLINNYEQEKVMPTFGKNAWDKIRKDEFETLVKELYEVEPALFVKLNTEQKKTFLHLLNLVLDSDERENLFSILQNIIELDQHDRIELEKILKTTKLSNIIRSLKLVQDRILTIDKLKELVFNHGLKANERDHLQKVIENHYWIFGEQYSLVCAAEDKFEKALKAYLYLLRGVEEHVSIDHPDKLSEMDIFLIRQDSDTKSLKNVIVELKNPTTVKRLGYKELAQVKKYMNVILSVDEFNAQTNSEWDFYLIGQDFDDAIVAEIENAKNHGEKDLAFKYKNYKIYIKKWSEIFIDVDLRLKWLNSKLQVEREKLSLQSDNIEDTIAILQSNSAIQPQKIQLPPGNGRPS
jgi:hypothetical protein